MKILAAGHRVKVNVTTKKHTGQLLRGKKHKVTFTSVIEMMPCAKKVKERRIESSQPQS